MLPYAMRYQRVSPSSLPTRLRRPLFDLRSDVCDWRIADAFSGRNSRSSRARSGATVCKLFAQGKLARVRISNAIRIAPGDAERAG
jgi:hypothetical protein